MAVFIACLTNVRFYLFLIYSMFWKYGLPNTGSRGYVIIPGNVYDVISTSLLSSSVRHGSDYELASVDNNSLSLSSCLLITWWKCQSKVQLTERLGQIQLPPSVNISFVNSNNMPNLTTEFPSKCHPLCPSPHPPSPNRHMYVHTKT